MKAFALLTFLISNLVYANFSYTGQSRNVFECFGNVDFKEYSPARRNMGFNICLKKFPVPNPEYNCSTLADRYYGLSAKNHAMNKCIEKIQTLDGCLMTADRMPAYPRRMSTAFQCLKRFESKLTKAKCYQVADRYHPMKKRIEKYCQEVFPEDGDSNQTSSETNSSLEDGSTEVINW